ncbi:MAG TPA: type II toxin-antitoxin system RelE/ParE family toxin [Chitinophagales bacterium]|nr:type II toxin-antitoxin system RelE/ParE family toxin [Chitinophagales bacterium]
MAQLIWTARALKDLEEIGEYISKDSIKYARLTIQKIVETSFLIEKNLWVGRIIPEINQKDKRELITGNYRIMYQVKDGEVGYILTIHHSSRLFSNNPHLKEE